MILLVAILFGVLAGVGYARIRGRRYDLHPLRHIESLIAAIFLQGLVFYFPFTRSRIPGQLAAVLFISSLVCLLIFVGLNRSEAGFWILGAGLALNLLVILANGGWMPISPTVAGRLVPAGSSYTLKTGDRFGTSKDVLLEPSDTRFVWLSDRFNLPPWFPWQYAFSFGDILIALGAFWNLWARGNSHDEEGYSFSERKKENSI